MVSTGSLVIEGGDNKLVNVTMWHRCQQKKPILTFHKKRGGVIIIAEIEMGVFGLDDLIGDKSKLTSGLH
jgi:hypothetical protein